VYGINLKISKLGDLSIMCDRDTENTFITVQLVLWRARIKKLWLVKDLRLLEL